MSSRRKRLALLAMLAGVSACTRPRHREGWPSIALAPVGDDRAVVLREKLEFPNKAPGPAELQLVSVSGRVLWSAAVGAPIEPSWISGAPSPIAVSLAAGSVAYAGNTELDVLDLATGSRRFSRPLPVEGAKVLALDDGSMIVWAPTAPGAWHVDRVSREGAVQWSLDEGRFPKLDSWWLDGERLLVNDGGRVTIVALSDGRVAARVRIGVGARPCTVGRSMFFTVDGGLSVTDLDSFETHGIAIVGAPVAPSGYVSLGCGARHGATSVFVRADDVDSSLLIVAPDGTTWNPGVRLAADWVDPRLARLPDELPRYVAIGGSTSDAKHVALLDLDTRTRVAAHGDDEEAWDVRVGDQLYELGWSGVARLDPETAKVLATRRFASLARDSLVAPAHAGAPIWFIEGTDPRALDPISLEPL